MGGETTPGSRVGLLEPLTRALEHLGGVGVGVTPEGCWCPAYAPADVPPYAHQHTPMCLELRDLAQRARQATNADAAGRPDNVQILGLGELQIAQIFEALLHGETHPNWSWAAGLAREYRMSHRMALSARLGARIPALRVVREGD
jgi:hypothetical protein